MFDLDNLNPSMKFDYDKDGKEWVKLRLPTNAKYNEFRETIGIKVKKELAYTKQGKPTQIDADIPYEQLIKLGELANDYMIEEWNLVTNAGDAIPCTPEIKKKMIEECPAFSTWIDECRTELEGNKKSIDEDTEKN